MDVNLNPTREDVDILEAREETIQLHEYHQRTDFQQDEIFMDYFKEYSEKYEL